MRLSFFLAVLVTTVIARIGFAHAENVPEIARQLRLPAEVQEERDVSSVVISAISSMKGKLTSASGKLADGVKNAAKLSNDQAAKLSKILANPEKAMAAFQASDDEIARMSSLIKKANAEGGLADDEVAKLAKVFVVAQKSTRASDDQVFSIAKIMANAKSAVKVSDDEVRKVSDMFKTARGGATGAAKYTDNDVAKLSKALAKAQKGASLSDKEVGKNVC